jgi:hypothetical protein
MTRISSILAIITTSGLLVAGTANAAIADRHNSFATGNLLVQNTSPINEEVDAIESGPVARPGDAELLKTDDGGLLSNQAATPVRLGGKFPPVREIVISPNRPDVELFPTNVEINQQIQGPSGYETKSNPAVLVIQ